MSDVFNIVSRHEKVAFIGIPGADGTVTYHRLQGFTEISESKNPKEYSRKYVDEQSERSDITGYSPSMSYAFDEIVGNKVHECLVGIADGEKCGAAAVVAIVNVDLTKEGSTAGSFQARKRNFTVVPDGAGDEEDAYTYSGEFKANGESISGTATTTDGWATCVFTEDAGE